MLLSASDLRFSRLDINGRAAGDVYKIKSLANLQRNAGCVASYADAALIRMLDLQRHLRRLRSVVVSLGAVDLPLPISSS